MVGYSVGAAAALVLLAVRSLRRSQRAALASEQRYRQLVELSPVAVLLNHSNRIVFANDCMRRLLGAPSAEALYGYQPRALVHPDSRPLEAARTADLAAGRVTRVPWVEQAWVRRDGSVVAVEVAATLVPWEDGVAIQVLARDLTNEKQARRRQQALLAAAEDANRTKDEFLATLSHELRTPLNAVLGWTQILLKQRHEDSVQHGLDVIRRNAEGLQAMVEEILQLSVVVTGQLRLSPARLDVRDIVRSAVETVAPAAATKGVHLGSSLPDPPIFIVGDARRWQQVFWNVLSNAVKFTAAQGRVEVSATAHEGLVTIVVRDTGQGISPEFLPHVFEPFRQEDSTPTRAAAGLGLGLALVRRLVEAQGGTIRAESAGRGQGATFTITLRQAQDQAPAGGPTRRRFERDLTTTGQ